MRLRPLVAVGAEVFASPSRWLHPRQVIEVIVEGEIDQTVGSETLRGAIERATREARQWIDDDIAGSKALAQWAQEA